jgi:2-polyprenyl-3-methyl-5-hydroxy-6-metoxy-1,4-benzoquinol methylase
VANAFEHAQGAGPQVALVRHLFKTKHRFSGDIVDRALASFGPLWANRLEETLARMFPSEVALEAAIRGYSAFAMDSLRRQARFERELDYPVKSYAEAAEEVYHNPHYMQTEYLPGLFLSHYLWPHHYRQILFFETAFLEAMKVADARDFAEVGIGTGLYSRIALQALPLASGRGIDISPSSRDFTDLHMRAFGLEERYEIALSDVTREELPPASYVICVEVLEHLEDPIEFLRGLRRLLKPGGRAFITAALNAAHGDHIYLYRNASEVEEHLVQAGFVTEQFFVGQAYRPPREGVPVPLAAAFVVY